MLDSAFNAADEVTMDGTKIKTTQEWSPYNPLILDACEETLELTIPTLDSGRDWMWNQIYGYSGLTVSKYLSMAPEMLQDRLKELLCNKDELTLLNWIYRIVSQKGDPNSQLVYQMPEDFIKSFDLQNETREIYLGRNDYVWLGATLKVVPVHDTTKGLSTEEATASNKRIRTYPIHSLKAITLFILYALATNHITESSSIEQERKLVISFNGICATYGKLQHTFWTAYEKEYLDAKITHEISGYLLSGQKYTATSVFIKYSILFE